jgi:hypothetical protein
MAFKERTLDASNKTTGDSETTGDSNTTTGDSENEGEEDVNNNPLMALIMTPTRELALQIKDHLAAATKFTSLKVNGISCTAMFLFVFLAQKRAASQNKVIFLVQPNIHVSL